MSASAVERVSLALQDSPGGLRAYKGKLPPKDNRVIPALVITMVSGDDDMDLEGDDTLRQRTVQLDSYASIESGAHDYMEDARAKMHAATVFSVGAVRPSGADDYEADVNLFRVSMEFDIWFNA